MRILVVDDYPPFLISLQRLLEVEHRVTVAATGREALSTLERDADFELVLLDVGMADLSGLEVHEELCARWPALRSRVAFMTGGAQTALVEDLLTFIAAPRLQKPFQDTELQALLARYESRP